MVDVQILDEDGKNGVVLQDYELQRVFNYARAWAGISNQSTQNRLVCETVKSIEQFLKERIFAHEHNRVGLK